VIPLEVIYAILDRLRADVVEAMESPPEGLRSEFGFGKLSGSLSTVKDIRARMDAFVEESDRKNRQKEDDES
jgi:hypothetical protein